VRAGHPAPPSGCRRGRGVSFRQAQGVPGKASGKVQAEKSLSRQKRDGEAWNAPGNYVFRNQLPAVFLIDGPREVSFVDIGLDGNDEYRVALKTDVKVKEYTLQPLGRNGIQRRRLVAPPGVLAEIRVFPIAGDGHFAVGYIVVSR